MKKLVMMAACAAMVMGASAEIVTGVSMTDDGILYVGTDEPCSIAVRFERQNGQDVTTSSCDMFAFDGTNAVALADAWCPHDGTTLNYCRIYATQVGATAKRIGWMRKVNAYELVSGNTAFYEEGVGEHWEWSNDQTNWHDVGTEPIAMPSATTQTDDDDGDDCECINRGCCHDGCYCECFFCESWRAAQPKKQKKTSKCPFLSFLYWVMGY